MHIKQEINAQNLGLRKECYMLATSFRCAMGVKSKGLNIPVTVMVPIYEQCSAFIILLLELFYVI